MTAGNQEQDGAAGGGDPGTAPDRPDPGESFASAGGNGPADGGSSPGEVLLAGSSVEGRGAVAPIRPGDRVLVPGRHLPVAGIPPAGRWPGVTVMAYTDEALPAVPVSRRSASAGGRAGAYGSGGRPGARSSSDPRLVLHPTSPAAAAHWLGGEECSGVLLESADHLAELLERRPDLARPRGGRPCWILLLLPSRADPGPWARSWTRVVTWSPSALPPVVVPQEALSDDPVGNTGAERDTRLWIAGAVRARRILLRMLEEPVPVPLVLPARRDGIGISPAMLIPEDVPVWWLFWRIELRQPGT